MRWLSLGDRRAARLGWPALHAELALLDPATAARASSSARSAGSACGKSSSPSRSAL
ncbi:tRNA delta(2)-isopentenylpyrophosphate transferase [Bordetella pertussis]|nr:tRNA delta(2)-isopentenylpyrophosphate transferase [Bordetella pertussis]